MLERLVLIPLTTFSTIIATGVEKNQPLIHVLILIITLFRNVTPYGVGDDSNHNSNEDDYIGNMIGDICLDYYENLHETV